MTTSRHTPPIVLIAGHWLGDWAWNEVLEHLATDHAQCITMTLPGLDANDDDRSSKTLEDQAAAIRDVIARNADRPVILVAHSGANLPVTLVLDRHPDLVARVIWVDSGPVADGTAFAPDLPADLEELPLPTFDELGQQASLDGLSTEVLERFRARAVPEPASVLRQPVALVNAERYRVPTTLVCCSISGEQVMELAEGGHPMFAEVANFTRVDVVDLPTGHWPMWSRPRDLAAAIRAAASRSE
ncbi:alpha/beta fold hydrolase [Leucobacter sp. USCH14]|uniref:alpha/beta fold hydrolase n=1 Tax=Leucobacter sp. USCH14 TaxID=3024838 RepID=UPI0030A7DBFE